MSSRHKKPPLNPASTALDVETYRLPRWDAQGNLVEDPRRQPEAPEDVDEVSVRAPTAEEIRQIHEDAYNEGFESGYEQGLRQGQQDGQKQGHQEGYAAGEQAGREAGEKAGYEAASAAEETRIQEHLQPLAGVLRELSALLPEQEAALKDGLLALAVRIARNVIDAELALKPDHIGELVHTAIQALPNADERLTVELNPDDLALVERVADSHWTLEPVPAITRGGCIVRTRFSYIDYTLEHRFRQQVSNLLAHVGLSEQLAAFEQPWPLPPADAEPGAPEVADNDIRREEQTDASPASAPGPETVTGADERFSPVEPPVEDEPIGDKAVDQPSSGAVPPESTDESPDADAGPEPERAPGERTDDGGPYGPDQ